MDRAVWCESDRSVAAEIASRHTWRMAARIHGTLQEFKDRLLPLDLDGEWEELANGVHKFMGRDRAGILWSETKGTVWFDGPAPQKDALAAKVEAILADSAVTAPIAADSTIFVVHGRDHNALDQLELVLRRLGLEPFVLQITGGGGDTLIEALERMIGKSAQSAFGIVLATPDDMGYLNGEDPEDAKPRARQNVIMEMGMLLASITRRRCAILTKGYVELPSNMGGVITIPFNEHVREAVPKLVQRLQDAGIKLDAGAVGRAQG